MKALIKSTGEILDVKSQYESFSVQIELPQDLADMLDEETKKYLIDVKDVQNVPLSNGTKYILSDDKSYNEEELIVGLDKIRDLKLTDII